MAATLTPNIGLKKPDREDYVSVVSDINDNMDTLDSKIGAVPQNKTVQGQIDGIGTEIGTVPSGKSVQDEIDDINMAIGSTALPTTAQTLTGAIEELDTDLDDKVDKVNGKGLSTNDFTDAYKQAVDDAASKVSGGTEDHIVTLDENGNMQDSGKGIDDLSPIDDTAGLGDDDVVWSADKTTKELIKKAQIIEETISTPSDIITIPDGADGLPMALTVGIEPVQDLHGYDNPWPAGGGKNKLPPLQTETKNGFTVTKNNDGTLKLSGYSSAESTFSLSFHLPAGSYRVTTLNAQTSSRIIFAVSKSGTNIAAGYINSVNRTELFTLSEDSDLIFSLTVQTYTNGDNIILKPMIYQGDGSNEITYFPYSNICPISGWTGANVTRTGKNLCDEMMNGYWAYANGNYTTSDEWICTKHKMPCKPDTDYVTSWSNGHYTRWQGFVWYDSNGNYIGTTNYQQTAINGKTAKSPKEAAYMTYNIASLYTGTPIIPADITDFQCEIGSSPTAYEAYRSNDTIEYEFPQSAGTVYGGTLTVNKDGTGKLTIDRKLLNLGSMNWSATAAGSYTRYSLFITDVKGASLSTDLSNILCEIYKTDTFAHAYAGTNDKIIAASGGGIHVIDSAYSSASDFKTAMNNVYCVYETSSPTIIDLSPVEITTLLGINNIWADTGDINSVTYPADTKLYVDQQIADKISASQHLMELIVTANHEDEMKATKAYSTGDLLIVNGTLYKATTSIANGANLTVNTNVTATTVAAELAALA